MLLSWTNNGVSRYKRVIYCQSFWYHLEGPDMALNRIVLFSDDFFFFPVTLAPKNNAVKTLWNNNCHILCVSKYTYDIHKPASYTLV